MAKTQTKSSNGLRKPPLAPALHAGDVLRIPRAFSRSECAEIIALSNGLERHADQFRSYGEVRGASSVCWLPTSASPEWLLDKLSGFLNDAAKAFDFDISGPMEDLKLIKYRRGNRVAWHVDSGGGPTRTRKLTLTALLSDPANFDGGALSLAGSAQELHGNIGDVAVFPSFLAHKVTTITRGNRHTLVVWAHGTPFR